MVNFLSTRDVNSYLRLTFVLFFTFLFHLFVLAQNKQASIWHIGNKKLDFNTTPITVSDVVAPFLGTASSIALADENGAYLLFTSSRTKKIYDKNYQEIINGDITFTAGQQRIMYIPKPDSPNLVYCFYDRRYALIDLQNSLALEKDEIWDNRTKPISNMYAVNHTYCNNIWLISQNSDGFYSYLVSNQGISTSPVLTPAHNYVGHRGTFSSSGEYYAIPNTVSNNVRDTVLINFGRFNRQTGKLVQTVLHKFLKYDLCFGAAFSSDNTKLYLFMKMRNSSIYHLLQVNIVNGIPDFNNSIVISTQVLGGFVSFSSMQLGIDGKIYQTYYFGKNINIIHTPNVLGAGCNYQENAIALTSNFNNTPIFIDTWFSSNYCEVDFCVENFCHTDNTIFSINNLSTVQSVLWNFGDNQTSTELTAVHTYAGAGTYTVTLTITFADNSSQTITKPVEIFAKPSKLIIEQQLRRK